MSKPEKNEATFTELKARNRALGHHWFDRGTMAFFASKLHGKPIACKRGGHAFISSEQFLSPSGPERDGPREYTIRWAKPNGAIDSVSEKIAFIDLAKDALRDFARAIPDGPGRFPTGPTRATRATRATRHPTGPTRTRVTRKGQTNERQRARAMGQ